MLFPLALAQAVSASPPERVDLTVPQPCQAQQADAGEIVVCANRDGQSPYRIKQPERRPEPGAPKAQVKIAEGVNAAAETEPADVGGFPSNRAMVRIKIKF